MLVALQVVTVNNVSDLYRYVDQKQLTSEFHGSLQFNQQDWIHQQMVKYYHIVSTLSDLI